MRLWDWVWENLIGPFAGPERTTGRSGTVRGRAAAHSQAAAATETLEAAPPGSPSPDDDRWWERQDATLTELGPVARPASPEVLSLENVIVAHFDGHDLNLPSMPRVPELVLRELASPNYNVRRIGTEVSEDAITAAAVLRLANSPLYRGARPITAVGPALVRVGAVAIRTLMLHQTMMSITRAEGKQLQRLADIIAMRAVASGAAMRMLATFTGVDPDEAFMYGLLHDIGAVMALRIINRQKDYGSQIDLDSFEYLAHQSHQEFGEMLGKAWDLPDDVTALMARHHQYPDAADPLRTERLMLHVTEMMGSLLGFAYDAPYDLLRSRALSDLGLADRADFLSALPKLPDQIEDALQTFV
jgi:HD-like signal output (HDOD) protein